MSARLFESLLCEQDVPADEPLDSLTPGHAMVAAALLYRKLAQPTLCQDLDVERYQFELGAMAAIAEQMVLLPCESADARTFLELALDDAHGVLMGLQGDAEEQPLH